MKDIWVLGINISNRPNAVDQVQDLMTKFGCSIRTRLGLHNTEPGSFNGRGLIILELHGDPAEFYKLENELLKIEGVDVQKMIFKPE
jgi:hypothetical protein